MDFKREFESALAAEAPDYVVLGVLTREAKIYPLGTDTKVLSTIFESIARPFIYRIAGDNGLDVWEPLTQNSYPDFTLMRDKQDPGKIAVDVKTTYSDGPDTKVNFTLGGYTSFIRNERKSIEFPYSEYAEHWIVGRP